MSLIIITVVAVILAVAFFIILGIWLYRWRKEGNRINEWRKGLKIGDMTDMGKVIRIWNGEVTTEYTNDIEIFYPPTP